MAKSKRVKRIVADIVPGEGPQSHHEVLKRYVFGPFELDVRRAVLAIGGEPLALGPRVVATLASLVERAGSVVTKDEILERVWPGEDVGESSITQAVYILRKTLRERGLDGAIATVPRRGYRFTASVERLEESPPPVRAMRQEIAAPSPRRRLGAVVAALVALTFAGPAAPERRPVPQLSAQGAQLYRLARYYWNLRTPLALARSERLFREVVQRDPRNPLGYSGEADADLMIADYEQPQVHQKRYFALARAGVRTALDLDPASAAAHTSLAQLSFMADHDAVRAETEFRRAIELDPAYATAHHWYGTMLLERGRVAEASRELSAAVTLDPVAPATGAWLAEASYYGRRYGEAVTYARRALDLDPHRGGALRRLGLAYELAGDLPHAIATFERMRGERAEASYAPALLAAAYAHAGRLRAARAAAREAVGLHPRDADTAFALLAVGEHARGLAILATMRTRDSYGSVALRDPRLDPFRSALLGRI
jgi:DNA-binding winged helix-turn-helix (wHTH) protein/Flp pilus assembly protein TadD